MECFFQIYSPSSISEIAGLNKLNNNDQQRIYSLVEGDEETANALEDVEIIYNQLSGVYCEHCSKDIVQGEVCVARGGRARCAACAAAACGPRLLDSPGYTRLAPAHQTWLRTIADGTNGSKEQVPTEGEIPCKKMKKEPLDTSQGDGAGTSEGEAMKQEIKLQEAQTEANGEFYVERIITKQEGNIEMNNVNDEIMVTYGPKSKEEIMRQQNDLFHKYRDALEGLPNLNQILKANGQKVNYTQQKDHLADCMTFGALESCPCGGQLVLDTFNYKCTGASAWSACALRSTAPRRRALAVPDKFRGKAAFEHYTPKVDVRLFRSPPHTKPQPLKNLEFFIYKDEIGGEIIKDETDGALTNDEIDGSLNNDDSGVPQNNADDSDVSLQNDDWGVPQNNADDSDVSLQNDDWGVPQNNADDSDVSLQNDDWGVPQNNADDSDVSLRNDDWGVSMNNDDSGVPQHNDDIYDNDVSNDSVNNDETNVSVTSDDSNVSMNNDDMNVSLNNDDMNDSGNNDDTNVSVASDDTNIMSVNNDDINDSVNNDDMNDSVNNDDTNVSVTIDDTNVSVTSDDTNVSVNKDDMNDSVNNDDMNDSVNNDDTNVSVASDDTNMSVNNDDMNDSVNNDDMNDSVNNDDTNVSVTSDDTNVSVTSDDTNVSVNNDDMNDSVNNDDMNDSVNNDDTNVSVASDDTNLSVNNDDMNVSLNNDDTNVLVNNETGDVQNIESRITQLGGKVSDSLKPGLAAVVWLWDRKQLGKASTATLKQIAELDIQVVHKSFIDVIDTKSDTVEHTLRLISKENIAEWGSDPATRLGIEYPSTSSWQPSAVPLGPVKYKAKGGVVVDAACPLGGVHVLVDKHGAAYSAVLTNTDVLTGQNSYYRLQLLRADTSEQYWVFLAWGRIGTDQGGTQFPHFKTRKEAKAMFFEKFKQKTKNEWKNRANFVKHPKCYYFQDLEYVISAVPGDEEKQNPALPHSVQRLVKKIFDIEEMQRALVVFQIDTAKMPLGKISRKQLSEAESVLSALLARLRSHAHDAQAVSDASSRYYSLVPRSFGLRGPPALDSQEAVQIEQHMLHQLQNIQLAYTMLDSGAASVAECYQSLRSRVAPLSRGSREYRLLHDYVTNTHGPTHHFTLHILKVFKVIRQGERSRYEKYSRLHNRRLLWHGSRLTNFAGILSQGLRVAPVGAPVTGEMFGKGIYFADVVTKSAQYCYADQNHREGLLLLCEVALGNMKECLQAENVTRLPPNLHSVFGVGKNQPDPGFTRWLENGTMVPLGPIVLANRLGELVYNEFVVYNVAQVNIQYLLQVKFDFKFTTGA